MKEIPLTKGYVAMVDDEDFEWLSQWKWHSSVSNRTVYAKRKDNGKTLMMHRFIMGVTDPNIEVDHIKGNGLDNRRESLRLCTRSQNGMNSSSQIGSSSRFKGVSWNKNRKTWDVSIVVNRRLKHLWSFNNEIEAAGYYNICAKKYYGDFARYNDVPPLHDGYVLKKKILPSNNTSGFRGVTRFGRSSKWLAKTKHEGKFLSIGVF